jgi:hypothetical protein
MENMPAIGVASWDLRWTCELCKVLESVEHVVVVAVETQLGFWLVSAQPTPASATGDFLCTSRHTLHQRLIPVQISRPPWLNGAAAL